MYIPLCSHPLRVWRPLKRLYFSPENTVVPGSFKIVAPLCPRCCRAFIKLRTSALVYFHCPLVLLVSLPYYWVVFKKSDIHGGITTVAGAVGRAQMSSHNFIFPPPPPPPPIAEPQNYSTNLQLQNQHIIGFRDFGNGRNRGGTGQRLGRGREAASRGSRGGRGRGGHNYGSNSKPYGYSHVSNGGYNSQGASYSSDDGHPLPNYPQAQFTTQAHHGYEAPNHPESSGYRAGVKYHTLQAHQLITPLPSPEQGPSFNRNQTSIPREYPSQSVASSDVRTQPLRGVGNFEMSPFIRIGFVEESMSHSRQHPIQSLPGGLNYETLQHQQSSNIFVPIHPGNSQKRMHAEAFGSTTSAVSRPMGPPPVPSFGAALSREPLPAMEKARRPKKKARKHNQLGLTPKTEEHESSSEEDVDEESQLAAAHHCSAKPAIEQ